MDPVAITWTRRAPGRWESNTPYPATIERRADGFHTYTPYWSGWNVPQPEYGWMEPGWGWVPWRTLKAAQDAVKAHFLGEGNML